MQGRFTSPDPLLASINIADPQTVNRYAYVRNNALRFIDPSGMKAEDVEHGGSDYDEEKFRRLKELQKESNPWVIKQDPKVVQKPATALGPNGEIPGDGDVLVINSEPASGLTAPIAAGSVASGVGEYTNVNSGYWHGANGKWYRMDHHPNGATGPRRVPVETAKGFKLFGRFCFFAGALNSANEYRVGNISGTKAGFDVGFSAVGTFGGFGGFMTNASYTFVDLVIGWDRVIDHENKYNPYMRKNIPPPGGIKILPEM